MAEKKKNEILEEQRRARKEFLRLKKMQQGELAPDPKPSEVAIVPKTKKEKLQNFWFQYKGRIIAITLIAIILAVMITQCVTKPKYDIKIVYFSYTATIDAQTELIADYFEKIATDINGDGEVNVLVINCSFEQNENNAQYRETMLSKMQATIVSDEEALLFITDEESIKYFENASIGNIFEEEPCYLGEDFYTATKDDKFGSLPKNLGISCRKISNTLIEDKGNVKEIYKESLKIIEKIKN